LAASFKPLALLLAAAIVVSGLFMGEFSSAQSTIKPDVPQFRIMLVKHSFDSAPFTTIDPFTGSATTEPSVHYDWLTVDLVITNQNLPEQKQSEGYGYNGLMFNVRYKGHFSEDWRNISAWGGQIDYLSGPYMPHTSGHKYTIFSLKLNGMGDIESSNEKDIVQGAIYIPINGTADFQVEALYGTSYKYMGVPLGQWVFNGQESGWSSTQSITLYENETGSDRIVNPTVTITTPTPEPTASPTPSPAINTPTPTPSPTNPEQKMDSTTLTLTTLIALAVALTAVSLVLLYRKNSSP
jgi:hypothetical protein